MITLGEVADIVSGYNVARLSEADQDRKYSNADFEHDFYQMKLASPSNPIIYRQSMAEHNMSATIIADDNQDKFISQVFSIMKVNTEKLNPWYLCYLLNESDIIARQCNVLLQGSVIARLSAYQLKQMQIPLPPVEEQERIGKLYATALYQYYLETTISGKKLQGILSLLHGTESK